MPAAELPTNETERLHALRAYRLLDTEPETAFDELAELAAEICQTPIALITLVDDSRQWFKARAGMSAQETARSVSFCAHAILQEDLFLVADARDDARFADNPMVTGPPYIRFYAGAPLHTDQGFGLGTLCVLDNEPRELSEFQSKALQILRRHVLTLMDLRRRNRELKHLNRELDAFTSAASHDLLAPVRRILGYCAVLQENLRQDTDGETPKLLGRIEASGRKMKLLIDSLLSLSRLALREVNIRKVDLSRLGREILGELQATDPQRQGTFEVAAGITVYADEGMMHSMLENLLGNAWKFSAGKEHPVVEVGVCKNGDDRIIYVRDNGVGFDMTYKDRLFMPFNRLHTESEFPGVGIGLATVQRIIRRHEGEIWVDATPGKGATFYFSL